MLEMFLILVFDQISLDSKEISVSVTFGDFIDFENSGFPERQKFRYLKNKTLIFPKKSVKVL